MAFLDDIEPISPRGVVGLMDCDECDRPVPVLGLPGKGIDPARFRSDYLCQGHAIRVPLREEVVA